VPHVPLAQLEEWFHGHYRQVGETVVALPHALEFMNFCRGRGVRSFLLSTLHQDHFQGQAERSGLGGYLERQYLGVWDKRRKIHELLSENGLEARETLYVGDMQHDVETARFGGTFSCAVLTGYNTLNQLREAAPDLITDRNLLFHGGLVRCLPGSLTQEKTSPNAASNEGSPLGRPRRPPKGPNPAGRSPRNPGWEGNSDLTPTEGSLKLSATFHET
jgi:phosphoglycolate phosphatase